MGSAQDPQALKPLLPMNAKTQDAETNALPFPHLRALISWSLFILVFYFLKLGIHHFAFHRFFAATVGAGFSFRLSRLGLFL